jgi:class 3 adenylate cyclase
MRARPVWPIMRRREDEPMGERKVSKVGRGSFASHYFRETDDGQLLYVPWGRRGVPPLARYSYVVPSEMSGAIERLHRRFSAAATTIVVAIFAFLLVPVLAMPDAVFEWLPRAAWWLLPVVATTAILPTLLAPWLVVNRLGPFERGPALSYRVYAADLSRVAPPWVVSGAAVVYVGLVVWLAYGIARSGAPGVAASIGAMALVLLPLAGVWPVMARVRRLRVENERLEAIVAERTAELKELNATLERRVKEQVDHIERLGQLKHFFAAPVAEMILKEKGFDPSKVHRRELTAVAVDLRGFTAFSETSEPEEVISVLRIYHAELGIQVNRCCATLEHFAGDGAMIFLNDPVELADHPMRAVDLAVALRTAMEPHLAEWRANGFDIGLGVGIATGYATLGAVGFEGRWEYAAIGTVCNLAARLCAEAKHGEIVVSRRFLSRIEGGARYEPLGERPLKGFSRPVEMFNIVEAQAPATVPA